MIGAPHIALDREEYSWPISPRTGHLVAPIRASCELHYASVHKGVRHAGVDSNQDMTMQEPRILVVAGFGRPLGLGILLRQRQHGHTGALWNQCKRDRDVCFRPTLFQILPAGLSLVLAVHASCRSKSIPHLVWRLQSSPGFDV